MRAARQLSFLDLLLSNLKPSGQPGALPKSYSTFRELKAKTVHTFGQNISCRQLIEEKLLRTRLPNGIRFSHFNTSCVKQEDLKSDITVKQFLNQLNNEQKEELLESLNVEILRNKYESHLGLSVSHMQHYLSRFGRPTSASEDVTGTLCEVSPKWLQKRLG